MKRKKSLNFILGFSVKNKTYDACKEEPAEVKYCESFSFGKGCKELKTCEKYKRAKNDF